MEHPKILHDGITFDDVLLIPARSDFVPSDADTHTRLTRSIELNIPLISAPMDTVTEAALAIALAQEGGIGIIHKNLSVENQAREVEKVKRSENGVIVDPITLPPTATIGTARRVMREYNVSGIPIVEGGDDDSESAATPAVQPAAATARQAAAARRHHDPARPEVSGGRQPHDRRRDDQGEPRHRAGRRPRSTRPSASSTRRRSRSSCWSTRRAGWPG